MINLKVKLRVPVSKDDHREGAPDASLVLLKYGDYECPYCGLAYHVVKRLQKALHDEMQFVFRNFPLTQAHPNAMNAARAAEAAGRQGKFWPMHDMLYENQDSLDPDSLLVYASTLRLDVGKFANDIVGAAVEDRILTDLEGGARSGVNGTPTFFINGYRYDGDWSYDVLLPVLQSLRHELVR